MVGKVFIVGAGPGDPELITLKGFKVLKIADVIVYDALVSRELLKYAKKNAELIFAGKRPGKHFMTQEEINKLLYEKAVQGKVVVRLKNGDPYVFGRGAEEVMFLKSKGIPCEVIPGVTSAIAVPAYAGIPVTFRGVSSSFAVITGREADGRKLHRVRIEDVARAVDTLIILMGVGTFKEIVERLRKVLPNTTPIAIIENGTTPNQKVITGTLSNITEKAKALKPPAIIIIGHVVSFRNSLWRLR